MNNWTDLIKDEPEYEYFCDLCNATLLTDRYHCDDCNSSNFDMCVKCFKDKGHKHEMTFVSEIEQEENEESENDEMDDDEVDEKEIDEIKEVSSCKIQ